MAEVYRFFNDVLYNASEVNDNFYFKKISGIKILPNNNVEELLHLTSATYQSTISAGIAWKLGYFYENTANRILSHDPVTITYKRIDRIVVRLDITGKTFLLTVLKGVETTGSPAAPAIDANTDVQVSQVLIDNTSGTPAYTITDERQLQIYSDCKKLLVTSSDLTLTNVYGDIDIMVNSGSARLVNISAGARCDSSGSGQILSLFPKAFVKSIGAGTVTLRIKAGGTGIGYDITLLQNEWVQLHWDGTGWFIIADDFSTDKIFTYTSGSGNHTVPAGRRSLKVTVTGGGQSGTAGAIDGSGSQTHGGAAAGTTFALIKNLNPGATIPYTVGAGGAATNTPFARNNGNDSTFNTTIIGQRGGYDGSPGVLGGGGSGGYLTVNGGDVNNGFDTARTSSPYNGGNGAASFWGGGGRGMADAVGQPGIAPGSGGGGSVYNNRLSGKGADGVIVVQYGESK